MPRLVVLIGAVWALASACDESPFDLVPADPELRQSPQELPVAGVTVRLEASLWRDFQPASPPDGKPLVAVIRVKSVDGTPIPPELRADFAWVLDGNLAWATDLNEEHPRGTGASFFEVVARSGPKWGPGIEVDVVVRLRDASGRVFLLQARSIPIQRTD